MTNKTKYQKSEKRTVQRSELRGAPYNPRKIAPASAKRLRESLKSHGLVGGIVWNQRTGNVVGGHQRLTQLDTLEGSDQYSVEVDVVDMDILDEKALNVALNNPTMQGQYDDDKLALVLEDIVKGNKNIERTGFTTNDICEMLGDVAYQGEFAEQHRNEAPIIDTITSIRDAVKEPKEPTQPSDTAGREPSLAVPTPATKADWTDPVATREALAARRKEYDGERDEMGDEDASFLLTFVFATNRQADLFRAKTGLDPSKLYYDRYEIEEAFKIELGE